MNCTGIFNFEAVGISYTQLFAKIEKTSCKKQTDMLYCKYNSYIIHYFFVFVKRKKGVFFNLSKKIFRGIGYFFCVLLIILCIIMIIATAAFGSQKVVDVFGYNIYIVDADGFESAPKGSAVLVRKCGALELEKGNLILWRNNDEQPSLGYIREITLSDGVYSLTLDENGKEHIAAESQIIGHAEFASPFLGQVILFIKAPIGVFCIAVLPCIALIIFDFIRAGVKNKPEVEVEPQFKNVVERASIEQQNKTRNSTIGVNSDGKASYNRQKVANTPAADQVLFELAARQQKKQRTEQQMNKFNPGVLPRENTKSTKPVRSEPTAEPKDYPKSSNSTITGARFKTPEELKNPLVTTPSKDKTAEIPIIPKRDLSDAFFAQTSVPTGRQKRSAPQIGKTVNESNSEKTEDSVKKSAVRAASGRKSSQILASKNIDDLISDDDDYHDKTRISNNVVDDILADIGKNNKN